MGVIITLVASLHAYAQVFPVDTIMGNGRSSNRINMVYLADGYQEAELDTFVVNAAKINNQMFSQTPFNAYKNFFNSFSIRVPSEQSGAIHLNTAWDCPTASPQPVDSPRTYFGSAFDQYNTHRLLVPLKYTEIYNVLASNISEYDQALVVVNSPYYGGSGGSFPATSTESMSAEIAIHEIGHSFAGLADEYWAGDIYAAEKPNMTANNDPATIKWKNWQGINDVGIYHVGTTAAGIPWYRPHEGCKMRYLTYPFCSVCTEAFIDRIHQLANMTDSIFPASTSFTLTSTDPVSFEVRAIHNTPSTIGIKWYLNSSPEPFATDQFQVAIPYDSLQNGANTIRAEVIDSTALSRSFLPGIGYISSTTWSVMKTEVLPVTLTNFGGKIDNHSAILQWEIDAPIDPAGFELQKSTDGISFSSLAGIQVRPNSKTYSYTDPDALAPYTYYRLKIIEKDGSFSYSAVIRLQNAIDNFYYKVYQQAEAKKYHLAIRLNDSKKIAMQITDIHGRRILRKDFGRIQTQLDFDFSLLDKPAGIYYLTLNIDNKNYNFQLLAR